jgi:hypothetical protein
VKIAALAEDTILTFILAADGIEHALSCSIKCSGGKRFDVATLAFTYGYLWKSEFRNAMRSTEKLGHEESILLEYNVSCDTPAKLEIHTSLKYSPTSPCRKVTIPVGSIFRASAVERAVTPNPCIH